MNGCEAAVTKCLSWLLEVQTAQCLPYRMGFFIKMTKIILIPYVQYTVIHRMHT